MSARWRYRLWAALYWTLLWPATLLVFPALFLSFVAERADVARRESRR